MGHLFTEHYISYINKTEKRKEVGRECKLVQIPLYSFPISVTAIIKIIRHHEKQKQGLC